MLSKKSLENEGGNCKDGEDRSLMPSTSSGLQDAPTGPWTKLMNGFPVQFSSDKILHNHNGSGAEKHRRAGYNLFKSNKVYRVLLSFALPNFVFCKAHVEASYSLKKKYTTQVKINKLDGSISAAYCGCPAGMGGVCKHVAAVLWFMLDCTLAGLQYIPDEVACTEEKCKWRTGGKSNVTTEKFGDLNFVKHTPGKPTRIKKKARLDSHTLSSQVIGNIHKSFTTAGFSAFYCATIEDGNFKSQTEPSASLAPLPTEPPPRAKDPHPPRPQLPLEIKWFEEVVSSHTVDFTSLGCDLTLSAAHELEAATRDQSSSDLWHTERGLRITSSKFKEIATRKSEVTPDFVKRVFNNAAKVQTKYMKMGLNNEDSVVGKYIAKTGATYSKCGFVVNPGAPFLGASPDGVVFDASVGEFGLIEIKTLSKAMEMGLSIADAVKSGKAPFFNKDIVLKKSHGYYFQVQGQLAITGLKWCDFVVDSGKDIVIERVLFDPVQWAHVLPKLALFYAKYKMNVENLVE